MKEKTEEMKLDGKTSRLPLNNEVSEQDEIKGASEIGEIINSWFSSQASVSQNLLSRATNKVPKVTMRRDFKICGQTGEKETLSYTNLIHQINRGLSKGHSESEVTEAVVKAVSPCLSISDMLEVTFPRWGQH